MIYHFYWAIEKKKHNKKCLYFKAMTYFFLEYSCYVITLLKASIYSKINYWQKTIIQNLFKFYSTIVYSR